MIQVIPDNFDYTIGIEREKERLRELNRKKRERKLGRPIGKHGGRRAGAGRPRTRKFDYEIGINVTRVQEQILKDMGNGSIEKGVNALIKELA